MTRHYPRVFRLAAKQIAHQLNLVPHSYFTMLTILIATFLAMVLWNSAARLVLSYSEYRESEHVAGDEVMLIVTEAVGTLGCTMLFVALWKVVVWNTDSYGPTPTRDHAEIVCRRCQFQPSSSWC